MGNAVKCPRCQSLVDVTSFAPGSSVRCSDCGGMMRVPTGRTGVNPAVKAPVANGGNGGTRTRVSAGGGGVTRAKTRIVGAAEMRETGTRTRQAAVGRGAPRPASKSGLYVLLGVLALALIIGGAVLFLGTPKNAPTADVPLAKAGPAPKAPVPPRPAPAAAPAPAPDPVDVAPPPPPRSGDEASKFNWEEALKQLRGGGGFDIDGRPEQVYYDRIKKLGKAAYPHLVKFIDNEDPALGRAAVAVLNALTNQKQPLPNDASKSKLKGEWEGWVKANP
jgi:hypothetical protein